MPPEAGPEKEGKHENDQASSRRSGGLSDFHELGGLPPSGPGRRPSGSPARRYPLPLRGARKPQGLRRRRRLAPPRRPQRPRPLRHRRRHDPPRRPRLLRLDLPSGDHRRMDDPGRAQAGHQAPKTPSLRREAPAVAQVRRPRGHHHRDLATGNPRLARLRSLGGLDAPLRRLGRGDRAPLGLRRPLRPRHRRLPFRRALLVPLSLPFGRLCGPPAEAGPHQGPTGRRQLHLLRRLQPPLSRRPRSHGRRERQQRRMPRLRPLRRGLPRRGDSFLRPRKTGPLRHRNGTAGAGPLLRRLRPGKEHLALADLGLPPQRDPGRRPRGSPLRLDERQPDRRNGRPHGGGDHRRRRPSRRHRTRPLPQKDRGRRRRGAEGADLPLPSGTP